jgi:hypothetical protein
MYSYLGKTLESFWQKVEREHFLLPTAYTAGRSLLRCQTNTLTVAEIQCKSSFMCIQIEFQGVRNVSSFSATNLSEFHVISLNGAVVPPTSEAGKFVLLINKFTFKFWPPPYTTGYKC